jgi:uncharacterized membrane protein YvlD (DUF360 family)
MVTIADVADPFLILSVGIGVAAFVLLIITSVEALVLRWGFNWGSFRRSLSDSLVINLTSAAVGVVLLIISLPLLNWGVGLALLVLLALTVLIEGAVLTLLKRHPWRKTWVAAIVINVVSYALIYAVILVGSPPQI